MKRRGHRVALILCIALVMCTPAPSYGDRAWWHDVVFYEIFVRSFYDSDGDGIGDLAGLTEKLDYLNDGDPDTTDDLGVGGIWLMPVAEAYSYHGYDVTDYQVVEPDYGDAAAFKSFVEAAHARDMRVIVDFVLNHTSSRHPWFESSQDPASPYRSWYVWQDENPGFVGPEGQRVWHPNPDGDGFYYAVFWDGMPDLNYREEAVTEAMQEAARFWLEEMDVDGFRLDAVKYLIRDDETQVHTAETYAWLTGFESFADEVLGGEGGFDTLTVGEIWDTTRLVVPYVTEEAVDLAFEFDLAGAILAAVQSGDPVWFAYVLDQVETAYPGQAYATFLTNHDQNRVMSQLRGDTERARLAATVLLTLPGVPFIYYGEEIGMTGVKPDEQIRTPMQWHATAHAGFTTGQPWFPVNDDYETVNVAALSDDADSLLNHYRRLIHLRNAHPSMRHGGLTPLSSDCDSVYGYLRYLEEEAVIVILNFDDAVQEGCAFSLDAGPLSEKPYQARALLQETEVVGPEVNAEGGFLNYRPGETLGPRRGMILELTQP